MEDEFGSVVLGGKSGRFVGAASVAQSVRERTQPKERTLGRAVHAHDVGGRLRGVDG